MKAWSYSSDSDIENRDALKRKLAEKAKRKAIRKAKKQAKEKAIAKPIKAISAPIEPIRYPGVPPYMPGMGSDFYLTREWLELRYRVILKYGRTCMACGAEDAQIHVDHIKPRSKFSSMELDFDNLQVLCSACNIGKGNWDYTDFRPKSMA